MASNTVGFQTIDIIEIQSNLCNTDTERTERSVRVREVSVLERSHYDEVTFQSLDTQSRVLSNKNNAEKWGSCEFLNLNRLTSFYCTTELPAALKTFGQEMVYTANYVPLAPRVSSMKRLNLYEFCSLGRRFSDHCPFWRGSLL